VEIHCVQKGENQQQGTDGEGNMQWLKTQKSVDKFSLKMNVG